jgi:acetolactate synthase-1/2/3 large subunit
MPTVWRADDPHYRKAPDMHVGDQLVDRLIGYGVRRVFGSPGGQTLPLYNGIARRPGEIDHVLMHDERSGAYAADGYARATGRVGVCDATVGPGASNLVSGLVEAYSSSVSLLAIVADIPRLWEHRRAFGSASQAFAQRDFLEPCVKYYGRTQTPESLPEMLHACVRIATSGRPGPTVLEIPDDVFAADAAASSFPATADLGSYPRTRTAPDPDAVSQAVSRLRASHRPMLVVGGGALHAHAEAEVAALAEALGCPVATTLTGKGVMSETHPLCVGVAGRFGAAVANAVLEEADCVIFVGCKTGQTTTLNWTLPYLETPVIHIDIDEDEIGRNYHDCVALVADAKLGAQALTKAVSAAGLSYGWDHERIRQLREAWWDGPVELKQARLPGVLKPQDMMRVLRSQMTDDDFFVSDASLASGWIGARWQTRRPGRQFFAPRGLAGLGWGLPAAIGVAEALRERPRDTDHEARPARVVCLAGDGGWGYSLTEVETATRRRLPLICVVLNNSTLAWIRHSAQTRYPDAMVSQDFADVSYAAAAEAMGARVATVDDLGRLEMALKTAFADDTDRPWVIEARSCAIETPVLPSRARPADDTPVDLGGY